MEGLRDLRFGNLLDNFEQFKMCGGDITNIPRFWEEFASITIDPGRQLGKMAWIQHTLTDEDIVVVTSESIRSLYIGATVNDPARIMTSSNVLLGDKIPFFRRCFIEDHKRVFQLFPRSSYSLKFEAMFEEVDRDAALKAQFYLM